MQARCWLTNPLQKIALTIRAGFHMNSIS
jgi:hypothetical protein